MRPTCLLRGLALLLATTALSSCDLLPGAREAPAQAVADSATEDETTAARPSRSRRGSSTRTAVSGASTRARAAAHADSVARADSSPPPPSPTPVQRARATMSTDLRRLAVAQSEHLANQGRYSARLSRLGIRYIPHNGVSVQLASGDERGWAAVATHEDFPGEQCAVWEGYASPEIIAIAPIDGTPGCSGR